MKLDFAFAWHWHGSNPQNQNSTFLLPSTWNFIDPLFDHLPGPPKGFDGADFQLSSCCNYETLWTMERSYQCQLVGWISKSKSSTVSQVFLLTSSRALKLQGPKRVSSKIGCSWQDLKNDLTVWVCTSKITHCWKIEKLCISTIII